MRKKSFLLRAAVVLAMLGLSVVVAQLPANAAAQSLGPWIIGNGESGLCLDVPNSNFTDNVQLDQWGCYPAPRHLNQQWTQTYVGTYKMPAGAPLAGTMQSFYKFATHNNECVTVKNASTAQSEAVIEFSCNGKTNQSWATIKTFTADNGLDYYYIVNLNSGKCLTVQNASQAGGAKIIQYTCNYSTHYNEVWSWVQ